MNLFAYGTLTFPEIVTALTGRSFNMQAATVNGFLVSSIAGRPYPALIPKLHAVANGWILYDIDDRSLKVLDEWEGTEYNRCKLIVRTEGNELEVLSYIWKGNIDWPQPWNRTAFRAQHLDNYLNQRIPNFSKRSAYNFVN